LKIHEGKWPTPSSLWGLEVISKKKEKRKKKKEKENRACSSVSARVCKPR
jgi:hypothetical protein